MTMNVNDGHSSGGGGGFLRNKLKLAFTSSNDILSGISNNISSRLSMFSTASLSSLNLESSSQNEAEYESDKELPLPLHKLPGTPEPMTSPHSEHRSPATMKEKFKETFKFEHIKPALEDLMLSRESSEPSTLPTNTPDSPKTGFRFTLSSFNQSLPKKLGDYKAMAIRTLSGETTDASGADKANNVYAISVECGDTSADHLNKIPAAENIKKSDSRDLDIISTGLSSRSFHSYYSLHATGPDPYDKLRYKNDVLSSGSVSEAGVCHSTSLDSSDSDPHKKLWVRSGSQTSLQSWASSLSYDSQTEEVNEVREFMRAFVDDVFKDAHNLAVDRKAEFGKLAQHFAVVLFECAEADDFSPAKSLMNMCFTYYHEVNSPGGRIERKEFVYQYLRQQSIWKTLRFWNAAFFDALQCERFLRPVVTRDQVENNRLQAVTDELHYQENITFGQLGTFTCNMHAFGLSKEMVIEFLRKQVTIASLRDDQVKLLRDNVDRMYSDKQEWN